MSLAELFAFLKTHGGAVVLLLMGFALLLVGVATGARLEAWQKNAEIATLKKDYAEEKAAAASAALTRLQAAQQRGDELAAQVAAAETARQQLGEEKDREIKKLTSGRACLGAGVVRLLNDRDQGTGIRDQLPTPTGFAALADSASAADPAYASDTDIALWARNARDQHDACRGRLESLRNWFAD